MYCDLLFTECFKSEKSGKCSHNGVCPYKTEKNPMTGKVKEYA